MIKEDFVSFETAKLLKEKGFDEPIQYFYKRSWLGTPRRRSWSVLKMKQKCYEFFCERLNKMAYAVLTAGTASVPRTPIRSAGTKE